MADFTLIKANPSQGEITSSLTGSTGDGAGLHFEAGGNIELTNSAAAEFGTSDFSLEFVLNQTGDNTNDNVIYYSHQTGNNRFYVFNDISQNTFDLGFVNSSGSTFQKAMAYDMSADYGTPTHYVLTCDRDGNATLYKNGNSVATVDISDQASVDIGASNTTSGYLGSWVSTYGVLGTFYRFRLWNKIVDAKALYERADVPFADQYGSQTDLTSGSFAGFGSFGTGVSESGGVLTATGGATGNIASKAISLVANAVYRVQYEILTISGGSGVAINPSGSGGLTPTRNATGVYTETMTVPSDASGTINVYTSSSMGAFNGTLGNITVQRIGCVSDYDLAFASPTQSLTVQDRSGAADGTCSASGVTQVQPVVQLNATAARIGTSAATPADGTLHVGTAAATASASADDIVIANTATSAGMTIKSGTSLNSQIYFADGDSGSSQYAGYLVYSHASNKMQLGTNAQTRLTIDSTGQITQTGEGVSYTIKNSDTSLGADQLIGGVAFEKTDGSGAGAGVVGGMRMHSEGSVGESSYLALSTADSSTNDVERMRIDSSGNIILPTAGQTIKTDLSSGGTTRTGVIELYNGSTGALSLKTDNQATGGIELWTEGAKRLEVQRNGATTFQKPDGAVVNLYRNDSEILDGNSFGRLQALSGDSNHTAGTEVGSIDFKAYGHQTGTRPRGQIRFQVANNTTQAEAMRIEPDKKVTFYGGVTFGAGGTLLDDYEEGTFTLTDASGAGLTLVNPEGFYTRVGNRVFISVAFGFPTTSNTSNTVLDGLPFFTSSGADSRGLVVSYSNTTNVAFAITQASTDEVRLYQSDGVNATNAMVSGKTVYLNGHYKV
jgi:hypothetical protein